MQFLHAQEFRTDEFEGYYNALLHRLDDTAGLKYRVFANLDIKGVRRDFGGSLEFFVNG